ncbi:MAG: hypothetical protein SOY64_06015 [Pyramidobacter sp.]|uniref:hypothetical protein n=1 Tax=Pyramidobacter sp. TaxID=1943581 RepID=UPI002A840D65|nr:hypothetical protein [Pyramidobacter sp.]MDY4032603.1 hypothetical protein [Pyramidobacter sp.]
MKYNLKKLYSTAVEFDDGSMAVFVSRWDDETETMTMVARNYLSFDGEANRPSRMDTEATRFLRDEAGDYIRYLSEAAETE